MVIILQTLLFKTGSVKLQNCVEWYWSCNTSFQHVLYIIVVVYHIIIMYVLYLYVFLVILLQTIIKSWEMPNSIITAHRRIIHTVHTLLCLLWLVVQGDFTHIHQGYACPNTSGATLKDYG